MVYFLLYNKTPPQGDIAKQMYLGSNDINNNPLCYLPTASWMKIFDVNGECMKY